MLLLVLASLCLLYAQSDGSRAAKQDELADLRETIRQSQARLKNLEAKARRSKEAGIEAARQARALDSLVDALQERERLLAMEMIGLRSQRDSLDLVRGRLTDEYLRTARALYTRKLITPSSSMLLLPEEHRRLALAERLFDHYARRQRERVAAIRSAHLVLRRQDSTLAVRHDRQLAVISERRRQMRSLQELEQRYSAEVKKTRSEATALETFVARKGAEAERIADMIAALDRREREASSTKAPAKKTATKTSESKKAEPRKSDAKKSATEETSTKKGDAGGSAPKSKSASTKETKKGSSKPAGSSDTKATAKGSKEKNASSEAKHDEPKRTESRSAAKGTFRPVWPCDSRKILHAYGERRNPRTNTVTINPGINIAASSGATARAADDGTVTLVSWLPSYGTIVIVEHGGGWRTVYANLSSASVSEGASVRRGGSIGTVGEAVDGEYLHFEVWRNHTRHDPASLLK